MRHVYIFARSTRLPAEPVSATEVAEIGALQVVGHAAVDNRAGQKYIEPGRAICGQV